jgi:predicted aspartyl protease
MKLPNRQLLVCLLILLALAVAGCQSPFVPRQVELGQERVVVPMRLENGVPLVDVFINSQGPYTFVLDTGAHTVNISQQLSSKLDLPQSGFVFASRPHKLPGLERAVRINTLRIGSAVFGEFDAVSCDFSEFHKLSQKFDGILIFSLFTDHLLTMDFLRSEVILENGQLPKPDGENLLPMDVRSGVPLIPVLVCDQLLRVLVDTGYNGNLILSDRLVDEKLPIKKRLEGTSESITLAGIERHWSAQLDGNVRLGGYLISNPVVDVSSRKPDGILGTAALSCFSLTFDQRSRVLRIGLDPRLSGLGGMRIRTKRDGWLVIEVKTDSRAERLGLKSGDLILQINDQTVANLEPEVLRKLGEQKEIRKLILTRDGQRIEIEVPEKESPASEAVPAATP